MIYEITSDLPTFKTLQFRAGMNIVLADKSLGSTDKQSRNGSGKTSLIELIHFLFAAKADKSSIFCSAALQEFSFAAQVDVGKQRVSVTRCGTSQGKVVVERSAVQPSSSETLTIKNWSNRLGKAMFGLPCEDDEKLAYGATFRSVFSYFVRRQNSGGFHAPIKQNSKQQIWDEQVAISFLLGLDAEIPQHLQLHRKKSEAITQIKKALKSSGFNEYFSTSAQLRTKLTVTEARSQKLKAQLEDFCVVPEYRVLEIEASNLTNQINVLSVEDSADRDLMTRLKSLLVEEKPPDTSDLDRLYRDAGVALPKVALKKFNEVQVFHSAIVANRHQHLTDEIAMLERHLELRGQEKTKLDTRRAEVMRILRAGGALDQFVKMQEEAGRIEAETTQLRRQLELVDKLDKSKDEFALERVQITQQLKHDHEVRGSFIREAILLFEELSNALYDRAGSLVVETTDKGPTFKVVIESSRSKGISNMQIFCFDLMLTELSARRGLGPGFLVHDSHLFDGVDERQTAKALELAAQKSATVGFQYIVTMNSDALPKEGFSEKFDVSAYVLPTRLTDASETGGLFGFKFA
jgi:uncharacterized protein YydD (DUF2326 family)